MTHRGTPKIDGIAVGEFTAVFLGEKGVRAKAAFINTRTGDTLGWTTNAQWSAATRLKLEELKALMEADLAGMYFEGDGGATPTTGPQGGLRFGGEEPAPAQGGLGEHLGIPSV